MAKKEAHTHPNNGRNGADEHANELFWADKIARQILTREKFHYTDDRIKKPDEYVVKTSASLSGVLHIGRLSDTIRGDSAVTALKDAGAKTKFIWVAENMDPLRKVPAGVPDDFGKYIGMPVTDIPDPGGSYESYAERHMEEYFKVVDQFVVNRMEKLSMRREYRKGTFTPYIRKLIGRAEEVREIQNKYRTHPLRKGWIPWTPVCEACGKIVTTKVTDIVDGKVAYRCQDYEFETTTAKGCGHKGEDDPSKGNGKLAWKSEWAAQWACWDVCCEGAGKEYQVPNSAFWINGEIAEKILEYPMAVPVFYEHLFIDGVKMSASLGNVVYPKDWLEVASPELLRLLYNKRLMTTRSFSWKDLPALYHEYDQLIRIHKGMVALTNEKEKSHCERLLGMSKMGRLDAPLDLSFSHAALVARLSPDEDTAISLLKKTDHWDERHRSQIFGVLSKARTWLEKYAPDQRYVVQDTVPEGIRLGEKQRKALHDVADALEKRDWKEKDLFNEFYAICERNGIKNTEFFRAAYQVLLDRERGPKLAPFLLMLGREKVVPLFRAA